MVGEFGGKKALIVGGLSGIGALLSRRLAAEGARVTAVGRRILPNSDLSADSGGITPIQRDFTNPEQRAEVLDLARETDVLCHVWGPFLQKPLDETTPADWDFLVSANLAFPGSLVSAALPRMRAAQWGRILLLGGTRTDEVRGFVSNAAYGAAKTGLASLAKSVSLSYAREGITCNALCPGFVDTGRCEPEAAGLLAEKMPDGSLLSESEVVNAALFLLRGALFNGISLRIDKGWEPKFI